MNLIKKLFVYTVIFSTVLTLSGFSFNVASATNLSEGMLVKRPDMSAVYYLYNDAGTLKRATFPNSATYFTWFKDFSSVVTVTADELGNIPLGKNVVYRPGTRLIKITTDPKVYAIEEGGVLRWIDSEETAKNLWGANWASWIDDMPDAFYAGNYNSTNAVANKITTTHSAGSLIKYANSNSIYYVVGDGTKRLITEAGFIANKFNEDFVIENVADTISYTNGVDITESEKDLYPITEGGATPVVTGGNLSVALSSNSPVSMIVPAGSPNTFSVFNFTAAEKDVLISSIKLTMPTGILGNPTYVDSITFFDNGIKVGSSKDMNSSREAVFNFSTPIKITAGTTKSLTVKAEIEAGQSGRFALGIASASDVIIDGGVVSGSFPVVGKEMVAVNDAEIGQVDLAGVINENVGGVQFGEQNVKLAGFTLSTKNEPVIWETIRFKNGGTNDSTILTNVRLMINGDDVAIGTIDGRYINFALNNYVIAKGDNINVEVYGDIGTASVGNTIDLFIENKSDVSFLGKDYGYGISITNIAALDAAGDGITVTLAAGDFTIAMDKTATPAKDVVAGSNDVVLATIKMTSNAENATVNYIKENGANRFDIFGTGLNCNELDNVELKDITTGAIYDVTIATSTINNARCGLTMNEEMTLVKGKTHTFELRADIMGPNDTNPADNGDTYQVTLEDGAFSITGDTSNAPITKITPASVTSAVTTVRGGRLDWTTMPLTSLNVVGGAGPELIYKAYLEVGSAIDLKLQSVKINTNGADTAFTDDNIAQLDLYIVEDGTERLLKSTAGSITETNAGADAYINFTSLNTTNRVLKAGKNVYLEVRATFTSSVPTTGAFDLEVEAGAVSVQDKDNNTVTPTITNPDVQSRMVTVASKGSLKAHLKTSDSKSDDDTYILAGTTTPHGRYLGEIAFTTQNEPVKIKALVLKNSGTATGADIKVVKLFDKDGNLVAYRAPIANGSVYFRDTDFLNDKAVLEADQKTSYYIGVEARGMNVSGDPESTAQFNKSIKYGFAPAATLSSFGLAAGEAVKAEGANSYEVITMAEGDGEEPGNNQYSSNTTLTKTASTTGSILTGISNAMSDGSLTGGTSKIVGKYKFVFDNGSNRTATNDELKAKLVELTLKFATSTGVTATDFQAYIEGKSGDIATSTVEGNVITFDLDSAGGFSADNQLVDGEITLVITANLDVSDNYQYIQTEIANLSADFTYNGGGATNWSNARLEGITKVTGATLSKN